MFDALPDFPLTIANTTLYVVDPHVRDCSLKDGFGTAATESAVDVMCTVIPAFRRAGANIEFIWSGLDTKGISRQLPQKLGPDARPFEFLTTDMNTSLGGIHPRIRALMQPSDRIHCKFTNIATENAPEIAQGIVERGSRNSVFIGFNFIDCVAFSAINVKHLKDVPPQCVTILRDASANSRIVEEEEQRSDCGVGSSMNWELLIASGVRIERSPAMMARLGIS